MPSEDAGRREHYADLYAPVEHDGPLGMVLGNCQAESLRQALAGSDVRFLRIPPVHELEATDLPHLERVLARATVVVAQPIRDDYRGLPLGTRQLLAAAPGARSAVVPVIRFAGLYPWQAIVRPPHDPSASPPIVPYHDLRTIAAAAGAAPSAPPSADALREVAAASVAQLRSRERAHSAVPISDAFAHPRFELVRTINHPGNPVWHALAERVHEALGLGGAPHQLDRQLLDRIHAPREAAVIDAHGLDDEPREHWIVDGDPVDDALVRAAHLDWYRARPDALQAGIDRHAGTMRVLGL
ncbi:WcbI family polysaccharide biosynthesis putative acetyltransferase [Agrococcus sp. Marseille-P2731]|uniref:WcbI family polysaccharide biosynthesis putative acetyltransferase n=1 Tax=Agrococcus sp. Marseille-P2731 TaxID=1841862 RepID=UPI00093148F5|nr:WcbI family polysaccharide biosynthesis putative acetyltransferase [Agrococcus sp. Marseille-P2731]